jgi:GNAT superfamily N-acetyltransferase
MKSESAATSGANDSQQSVLSHRDVATRENAFIEARRTHAGLPPEQREPKQDLVGLAFSGGGIRSATFCLGVLQGLAKLNLLPRVDYLSTVSGGGYIGSWFVALTRRAPFNGQIQAVQSALNAVDDRQTAGLAAQQPAQPQGGAPTPATATPQPEQRVRDSLRYLQANSNYLTQRTGFLSLDTWVLLAIYLRNLLVTQLCLLPVLFAVPVFAHLLVALMQSTPEPPLLTGLAWLVFALTGLGLGYLFCTLIAHRNDSAKSDRTPLEDQGWRLAGVLVLTALGLTWLMTTGSSAGGAAGPWSFLLGKPPFSTSFSWAELGGFASLASLARLVLAMLVGQRAAWTTEPFACKARYWVVATIMGAALGSLLYLLGAWILRPLNGDPCWLLVIGPAATLLMLMIATNLEAVLPGYLHDELVREAWATYGSLCLLCGIAWFAVVGVSLKGACLIGLAGSTWAKSGLTASWLVATGFGLLAGGGTRNGSEKSRNWSNLLATSAPYLFLLGLGCLLSLLVRKLPGLADPTHPEQDPLTLALWFAGLLVVPGLLSCWLDVNDLSLNALYANRLTRAYLGASNQQRFDGGTGKPIRRSRFLLSDDLKLAELQPGAHYSGPYLLVNTALNLAAGDNLSWQERKAASFVITPGHMGCADLPSNQGGYYPMDQQPMAAPHAGLRQGMLGRAISISGAAANPNMGYHTSPAITALMTFFNVRLGWWLPNPLKNPPVPAGKRPSSVLVWLLKELFGQTDDKATFLNISDGGHFENLGVYELVRRRCRLIIAVDGEADPNLAFHGLGTLVRRCRTDLGIDVEIDVERMRRDATTGRSREHIAIGTIRYDLEDPTHPVGTLVYIKATLTGDEPGDVLQYAQAHPDFPHQTTADQFFDESQFESYRSLGQHCVLKAFRPLVGSPGVSAGSEPVETLVYELRRRGFPPLPESGENFLQAVEPFAELHKAFRDQSPPSAVAQAMYSELPTPAGGVADVHTSLLMVQVLENAWFTLNLDEQSAHPLHTGWMNLLHRWSQIPPLRECWPVIRHEFSRGFVEFCERVGGLPKPERAVTLVKTSDNVSTLSAAFAVDKDFDGNTLTVGAKEIRALALKVSGQSGTSEIPIGYWALRSNGTTEELTVWVRPRYRGHGHGTFLLDDFCKSRRGSGQPPVTVKLRMAQQATHKAAAIDKARLLSFFTRYGFRMAKSQQAANQIEMILQ